MGDEADAMWDAEMIREGYEAFCGHIAVISISKTKCQCMDCLKTWDKHKGFKSDFPQYDRG